MAAPSTAAEQPYHRAEIPIQKAVSHEPDSKPLSQGSKP